LDPLAVALIVRFLPDTCALTTGLVKLMASGAATATLTGAEVAVAP
jgi:hypothetical protein